MMIPPLVDMAQVYLKKELYERVVRSKADVTVFVNLAVAEKLERERK
nr:hypothetical protein [Ferrimicrobium acidiphilum]